MLDPTIPRPLREMIERELEPRERVEWTGMPGRRFFTPGATAACLFAIPWTAFALFWTAGAAGFKLPDFDDGADFFPLFGLPFILIGLGMFSSPLWAYYRSGRTVYVITNQRAILFEGGRSITVRSFLPHKLTEVYRREKPNGTGDLIISRRAWSDTDNQNQYDEIGFLNIPEVKEVERRLKALAEGAG